MIQIKEKKNCCGCEACLSICPKSCIEMVEDSEGFRYPIVNEEKCIHCGLCEKVCPLINSAQNTHLEETEFYAAYNLDDDILKESSSGGIFFCLVKAIIQESGVVYGVYQDSPLEVQFGRADTIEDCKKFMGSKYLQAKVNKIYKSVLKDLKEERKVLFSGTPCQIAALYNFIGKNYENLYTCDVVCHGVPSNMVYRQYIQYLQSKYQKKVKNIKFRDKSEGWAPNRLKIEFMDGTFVTVRSSDSIFQKGFLENYYLRKSCYSCKYAKLPRIGDISLADFWGYDGNLENENRGLSIVIVSTEKGKMLFSQITDKIEFHQVNQEYVTTRSRHVWIHPSQNVEREEFLKKLNGIEFEKLANRYYMNPTVWKKIRKKVKSLIGEHTRES